MSLVNFLPDPAPASANPIEDKRSAATVTTVNVGAASTLVLASNENRAYYLLRNNGNVPIYVSEGVAATVANAAYIIQPGKGWEEGFNGTPRFTGALNAIVASGTCELKVSEANLLP